jgi:hypothetical protein
MEFVYAALRQIDLYKPFGSAVKLGLTLLK